MLHLSKNHNFTPCFRNSININYIIINQKLMSSELYEGNELELSMLTSTLENVLEGSSGIVSICGAVGSGKTAVVLRLLHKMKSQGTLEHYSNIAGRDITADMFVVVSEPNIKLLNSDKYNIVWFDNMQRMSDNKLKAIREFCRCTAETYTSGILTILSYSTGCTNAASSLIPILQDITSTMEKKGVSITTIETKPLKLADVASLVSRIYSVNNFESNFANRLYRLTGGNQLFLRMLLEYMEDTKIISKDENNVYTAINIPDTINSLADIMRNRVSLLTQSQYESSNINPNELDKMCNILLNHDIMDAETKRRFVSLLKKIARSDNNTKSRQLAESTLQNISDNDDNNNSYSTDNSDISIPLKTLLQEYRMSEVIETADRLVATLPSSQKEEYIDALCCKCEALLFLGLYPKASEIANNIIGMASQENITSAIMQGYYLKGMSIGFQYKYEASDNCFATAFQIAESLGKYEEAAIYLCRRSLFLLEIPNLKKMHAIINKVLEMGKTHSIGRAIWEIQLSILQYKLAKDELFDDTTKLYEAVKYFESIHDVKYEARFHNAIALYKQNSFDIQDAENHFQIATSLYSSINDNVGLVSVFNNMGQLQFDTGNYNMAIEYYSKSASIAERLAILSPISFAYVGIGTSYIYLGDLIKAKEYIEKCIKIAYQTGRDTVVAGAYSAMADLQMQMANYTKSMEYYTKVLEIDRRLDDMQNVTSDLTNIASLYCTMHEIEKGIKYIQEIEQQPDNSDSIKAVIYNTYGNLYAELPDSNKALKYYNDALAINLNRGDNVNASLNMYNMSLLYTNMGEHDMAEQTIEKAVEKDRTTYDQLQLATHLMRLGECKVALGKNEEGHNAYMEAVSIYKSLNLMSEAASALRFCGDVARINNQMTTAHKNIDEALNIYKELGNFKEQAITYGMMAELAVSENNSDSAISIAEKAVAMFDTNNIEKDITYAHILQILAGAYRMHKEPNMAIDCYHRLTTLYRDTNPELYVENAILEASMLVGCQNTKAAQKVYDAINDIIPKISDIKLKASALNEIGTFYCSTDRIDTGIEIKHKAIDIIGNDISCIETKGQIYLSAADALYDAGMYDEAIEEYKEAYQLYDNFDMKEKAAFVCNNIGYTYDTIAKCEKAIKYYLMAFKLYKEKNNISGMYNNINNVALMFERSGNMSEALKFYKKAIEFVNEKEYPIEYAGSLFNIGRCIAATYNDLFEISRIVSKASCVYFEEDYFENAVSCQETLALLLAQHGASNTLDVQINELNKLLDMAETADEKVNTLISLAAVYFFKGQYESAIEHFYKAVKIRTDQDSWVEIARCHYNMALKMCYNPKKFDVEIPIKGEMRKISDFSMECLDFAAKIANKENEKTLLSEVLDARANLKNEIGNKEGAFHDISDAIENSSDVEFQMSLAIRKGTWTYEQQEYDKALAIFEDVANTSEKNDLFDTLYLAKGWQSLILFKKGMPNEAMEIIRNTDTDYYYIYASISDLMSFVSENLH